MEKPQPRKQLQRAALDIGVDVRLTGSRNNSRDLELQTERKGRQPKIAKRFGWSGKEGVSPFEV